MRDFFKTLVAIAVTVIAAGAVGSLEAEENGKPLVVPGKQSIYQRVLTRPGAKLAQNPGEEQGISQPAFSRFYVYERRDLEGKEWLLVGDTSSGRTNGWMPTGGTIPWKQQMALAFTNPANRERTLLFADREAVMNVVLAEDPGVMARPIRQAALRAGGDQRVISIEPETFIDITENFYLLPILEAEEVASHRGYQRVLKVASIAGQEGGKTGKVAPETAATQSAVSSGSSADEPSASTEALDSQSGGAEGSAAEAVNVTSGVAVPAVETGGVDNSEKLTPAGSDPIEALSEQVHAAADALKSYSSAIVFVIDSTISMGPYIDRTREAVRRIYDKIAQAGLLGQMKFGLVAYRSNIEAAPQLEYVTQVYASPNEIRGGEDFLAKVSGLQPASVSSPRFDEDAYAGVMTALDGVDWYQFGGRYLVLITDAGALDAENPLSKWKVGAEQVRIEAEQFGIALYALHLKTPQGKGNHPSAERQYKTLTENSILGRPLYYPVDAGSVDEFGTIVDTLAESIVEQVKSASLGKMIEVPPAATPLPEDPAPSQAPGPAAAQAVAEGPQDVTAQVRADAALLGHAMQLAYLGRVQGTQAPDLFEAWLCDRDFANPDIATTEVRVLLTKNELSNLRDVVQAILDAGEQAQEDTSTADFFDLLRSSAAHLARDPSQITNPEATKLGEMGLLGEYLDGLPYRSDVMNLTSDVWEQWGTTQQEEFLDGLRRKLRHYQIYHDDADRWVSLNPGAGSGEDVYPVPLQALP